VFFGVDVDQQLALSAVFFLDIFFGYFQEDALQEIEPLGWGGQIV
jgi:hypothetical protein